MKLFLFRAGEIKLIFSEFDPIKGSLSPWLTHHLDNVRATGKAESGISFLKETSLTRAPARAS